MSLTIHPTFLFFLPRFWRNYYLATPIFIFLDIFFGVSIRIPFLDNLPLLKYIFYAGLFFSGIIISNAPNTAKIISIAECTLSLVLNIIGFLYPLYGMMPDVGMEELQKAAQYYTPDTIIHFAMTGFLLTFWFYQAQFELIRK